MFQMGRKYTNRRRKRNKTEVYTSVRSSSNAGTIDISAYRFEITRESVERLESFQKELSGEFCGIILGSTIGERTYRINFISEICNKSSSNKTGCERDAKKANEIIGREYEKSSHTRVYMGEWHTHPENFPRPSIVDLNSVSKIYFTDELVIDGVLLCIVGLRKIYWGFYSKGNLFDISPELI